METLPVGYVLDQVQIKNVILVLLKGREFCDHKLLQNLFLRLRHE